LVFWQAPVSSVPSVRAVVPSSISSSPFSPLCALLGGSLGARRIPAQLSGGTGSRGTQSERRTQSDCSVHCTPNHRATRSVNNRHTLR
jgi:hypothetical protein